MNELIKITGAKEVCDFLDTAPTLICIAAVGKALQAASEVVMAALAADTPIQMVGAGEGTVRDVDAAHLVTSLVTDLVMASSGKGGYVEIGYGRLGYRAYWVEYGHHMIGHRPDKKELGEVPAHPFMRKAFERCADMAIAAFADSIAASIAEWVAEGLG